MKAGRELDALIAEKVMGFDIVPGPGELGIKVNITECRRIPPYSKNIAAAWEVVKSFGGRFEFSLEEDQGELMPWIASFSRLDASDMASAEAETAPHAICLAALRAVGA
jgi:hypothetical protein